MAPSGAPGSCIQAFMLNLRDQDKCMSSYFCGAKVAPWPAAQAIQSLCTFSRSRQLAPVESTPSILHTKLNRSLCEVHSVQA